MDLDVLDVCIQTEFGAEGFEIVAINDLTSPKDAGSLIKYDSTQGKI